MTPIPDDVFRRFEKWIPSQTHPSVMARVAEVCDRWNITPNGLLTDRSRNARMTLARQMVMYYAFKDGASLSEIGRVLNRDHTSVNNGVRKIERLLEENP